MGKWILIGLLSVFCMCCFGETTDQVDSDSALSGYGFGYKQFQDSQSENPFTGTENEPGAGNPFLEQTRVLPAENVNPFTGQVESTPSDSPTSPNEYLGAYGNRGDAEAKTWSLDNNLTNSGDGFFSEYERLSSQFWDDPEKQHAK